MMETTGESPSSMPSPGDRQEGSSWRAYPSTLVERHLAAAASLFSPEDGFEYGVVVAGGRDSNNKVLKHVEMFEVATDSWNPVPPLHQARFGFSMVSLGDSVYVIGGQHSVLKHDSALASVESWHRGDAYWKVEEPMPACRIYAAAAAVVSEQRSTIVVVGGRDGVVSAPLKSVVCFETNSPLGIWRELPPMKEARMGCAAVPIGTSKIMVLGGFDGRVWLNTNEIFDFDTNQWTLLESRIPIGVGFAGATSIFSSEVPDEDKNEDGDRHAGGSDHVFLFGGTSGNHRLTSIFHCSVRHNHESIQERGQGQPLTQTSSTTTTDGWSTLETKLPVGREGLCCAAFHDRILVVGGSAGTEFSFSPTKLTGVLHVDGLIGKKSTTGEHNPEFGRTIEGSEPAEQAESLLMGQRGDASSTRSPTEVMIEAAVIDRSFRRTSAHRQPSAAIAVPAIAVPIRYPEDGGSALSTGTHSVDPPPPPKHATTLPVENPVRVVESLVLVKNHHNALYSGEVDASKLPHGHGRIKFDCDGSKYEGDWWRGMREGLGRATFVNGDSYEGYFHDDMFHGGNAVFQWSDGRQYEGSFVRDKRHGIGSLTWKDGRQYKGEFVKGARTGYGKMTFPSGWTYEGEFLNGKFHGIGVCQYADGRYYHGQFEKGKAHGIGRLYTETGLLTNAGRFVNDKPVLESDFRNINSTS